MYFYKSLYFSLKNTYIFSTKYARFVDFCQTQVLDNYETYYSIKIQNKTTYTKVQKLIDKWNKKVV